MHQYWECATCLRAFEARNARLVEMSSDQIAAQVATIEAATDPREIAQKIIVASWEVPYEPIRRAWTTLVRSGKLQVEPVADLVTMRFSRSVLRSSWEEVSRKSTWRCGGTWIDADGRPWRESSVGLQAGKSTDLVVNRGEASVISDRRAVPGVHVEQTGREAGLTAIKGILADSHLTSH